MEHELASKSLDPFWTLGAARGDKHAGAEAGVGPNNSRWVSGGRGTDEAKSAESCGVSSVSSDSLSLTASVGSVEGMGACGPGQPFVVTHALPPVPQGPHAGLITTTSASASATTSVTTSATTSATCVTSAVTGLGQDVSVSSGRILQTVAALKSTTSGFSSPRRRSVVPPVAPVNASASVQYRQAHGSMRSVSPCSPLGSAGVGAGGAGQHIQFHGSGASLGYARNCSSAS
jgi:hypothetical protein